MFETITEQCGNPNGASWDDARTLRTIVCRMVRDQYASKRRRGIPTDVAWQSAQDDVAAIVGMAESSARNDAAQQLADIAIDGILP